MRWGKKSSDQTSVAMFAVSYSLLSLLAFALNRNLLHLVLLWNDFLALIPLWLANRFESALRRRSAAAILFVFLWLIFFPNAPYMLTDFIHLQNVSFYSVSPYLPAVYSRQLSVWIGLIQMGIGVLVGIASGMFSLYIVHRALTRRFESQRAALLLMPVFLLSGYAMYIGRFLRLNSWDVFRPQLLFAAILRPTFFSLVMAILFGWFILSAYWLFLILLTRLRDDSGRKI
ncbi:MAG: DUF1361 domain-containing protein [Sporolactobacillus sp.]|jgi:uncharacterized membrane protein|nr:DUF1361 domain-containing protein [Sporolactobacillus sp.]MCI1882040.1 DUF1361 domain-containing protein [Sporolactobacillus sp.]